MDKKIKPYCNVNGIPTAQPVPGRFHVIRGPMDYIYSDGDLTLNLETQALENIEESFTSYKKLKSANILYGDARRLKIYGKEGTLFENTLNLKMIMTLRNEVVHNGSFENIAKVYQLFENNIMIEKFIFLPDLKDGVFRTVRSRKRFFDQEIKLNELIPGLVSDFWKRLDKTFSEMLK